MRAVNLLPRETIRVEGPRLPNAALYVAAAIVPVVAGGLVVIGYTSAHSLVHSRNVQVAALQAALPATASAPAVTASPPGLTELATSVSARRAALADALGKQVPWDTALGDLARVIPAGAWLTQLSASSPTSPEASAPPPAPTGSSTTTTSSPPPSSSSSSNGFTTTGYAESEEVLALLLSRLQLLPSLTNVTLTSASAATVGNKDLVQFTITAGVSLTSGTGRP